MMNHIESFQKRKAQLLWRSRRGMYELDLLLHHYVYTNYAHLSEHTVLLLESLLTYDDDQLYEWFYCDKQPENPAIVRLVSQIKRAVQQKHQT